MEEEFLIMSKLEKNQLSLYLNQSLDCLSDCMLLTLIHGNEFKHNVLGLQTFIQIVRFKLLKEPYQIKLQDLNHIIDGHTKITSSFTVSSGKLELRLWNHINHLSDCISDLRVLLLVTHDTN
jgi:hypothetical protein